MPDDVAIPEALFIETVRATGREMKCLHCQGELRQSKVPYAVNRHGYHLIIDDVPAWVCSQCGEPLFDEKQVDAIQQIIRKIDTDVPLVLQVA